MSLPLSIDLTGLTSLAIGDAGISLDEIQALADKARSAVEHIAGLRRSGEVGFFDLPDEKALATSVMDYAAALPPAVDTMVVIGIGGSSLGPHAVYSALAPAYDPLRTRAPGMPRRLLFPDNSDPVTFQGILDVCDPERTVFNVVTKSGGTAETAAQLLVLFDWLRAKRGPDWKNHLVVTTDPERGALRKAANELELQTFPVPPSVGGRFSVLSAVGLLPAAVAGLDVQGLLDGARAVRDAVADEGDIMKNPALLLAALLYLHHEKRGRPMAVVMPYADALFDTADWFRQLWAESLGKVRPDGTHVGPTPIASRGATDQHSQLQLYAEGPADKVFLFLAPEQRGHDIEVPRNALAEDPAFGYLAGNGLGTLLDAELRGTMASLAGRGRPTAAIKLPRLDAPALGGLFLLLEAATAFAGPLYGVNPFDQPGVEEAKRLAFAALGREGYDKERQVLEQGGTRDARFCF